VLEVILEQTHPRGYFWLLLSSGARRAFLSMYCVFPTIDDHNRRYQPDQPLADELRAFFG
jgi:hypothetical protein